MDQSSADPEQLDGWAKASRGLDEPLTRQQRFLAEQQGEFSSATTWGNFDASRLIESLGTYVGYNETDAQWTSTISETFRQADAAGGLASAGGGAVKMPEVAVTAGLLKAGQPTSISGSRALETLSASRVGRNAAGLIDRVDGRPVEEFLRDFAERRAGQFNALTGKGVLSPRDATAVAINRHSGEMFEGSPVDVVARAGESGLSALSHAAGKEIGAARRMVHC